MAWGAGLSASSFIREVIMKSRKYKEGDLEKVQKATALLKEARDLLKGAGVTRTTDRVRKALSSARGAEYNVYHRKLRSENPHLYGRAHG